MSVKKHTGSELRVAIIIVVIIAAVGLIMAIVIPIRVTRNSSGEQLTAPEPAATSTDIQSQTASVPQIRHREPIFYDAVTLNGTTTSAFNQLEEAVGASNVETVLKLNRIDAKFLKTGTTLTVPEDFGDFMELSPFPRELPLAGSIPELLVISKRVQAFGAYESGQLVRWGPVSTGTRSSQTPSKLYSANWREKEARSSFNYSWLMPWALNIDNRIGINIHQYDMPGYPASHSCVRTKEDDAKWLYSWVDLWLMSGDGAFRAHGGPVIIFGSYAYDETAPWKNLPLDHTATTISVDELEAELAGYMETIQSRLDGRSRILGTTF